MCSWQEMRSLNLGTLRSPAVTRWVDNTLCPSRRFTESKNVPSADYGTNNPPLVRGTASPPVLRWDSEERSSDHSGWKLSWRATSHCRRKKLSRPNRVKKRFFWPRSASWRACFAPEVGGLLHSPLIALNDSNGRTSEIKSTYSHAPVKMHTGPSNTDFHSDPLGPTPTLAFVLERLVAVARRQHPDFYF